MNSGVLSAGSTGQCIYRRLSSVGTAVPERTSGYIIDRLTNVFPTDGGENRDALGAQYAERQLLPWFCITCSLLAGKDIWNGERYACKCLI